jgi:hypothetical protein
LRSAPNADVKRAGAIIETMVHRPTERDWRLLIGHQYEAGQPRVSEGAGRVVQSLRCDGVPHVFPPAFYLPDRSLRHPKHSRSHTAPRTLPPFGAA